MSHTYATNLQTVMIAEMSQFVSSGGTNLGIGYAGWDDALAYARENDLDYFGSIFLAGGESESPESFSYGMWMWTILVRMHVRYDGKDAQLCDKNTMDLAEAFLGVMKSTESRQAVASSGWVKLNAANYISQPVYVNDVAYISMEFLVAIKEQIDG